MAETEEISDFVNKYSRALRRSKRIPSNYKSRLRRLQALDSLLRVRKLNEGLVTSNDYRELLLATVADPSIPKEVRQRMKDLAVQVLSPDDEFCDFRDKEMEQLLNRLLSGKVSFEAMADLYTHGTLDRLMDYIEKLLDRADDGEGGYDEKLLELLSKGRPNGGFARHWGPDKLIRLDFVYRNFAKYFGNEESHDAVRKRILNRLSSLGRSLEKRKSQRSGPEDSTVKRLYSTGDEIDQIDFEDTLEAVLNSSHDSATISPEDIVVREESSELVTAILLQDVSMSMFQYYPSVIPCFVLAYSALKLAKRGVCIFAGNAYPIKSVAEDLEEEKTINTYYNMIHASLNQGLTMGTMGQATFQWAEEELERAGSGRKMVFLFSDCGFNEYGSPLSIVRRLNERGAEVVIVHPDVKRGFFGWGPYGGPNLVHEFEKHGCRVLECTPFNQFSNDLQDVL